MEIDVFIKEMKNIHSLLIDFFDATDDSDSEFKTLIDFLEEQKFLQNEEDVQLLFQLISKIAGNHHQTSDFFDKFEKIFQYFKKDIPPPLSYFIPDYTHYNRTILFILLKKHFVIPDQSFINQIKLSLLTRCTYQLSYYFYLYLSVKDYIDLQTQKKN